ncbi:MAG: cysteine desulfurase family protein [Parachlamydiaceae bacterium]
MSKKQIYLDHNASTWIDPRVLSVVVNSLSESIGNPSSIHYFGQKSRAKLSQARQTIASTLGVKANEIIFTSGGTEGANFCIRGLLNLRSPGHLITSSIEHACVYETCKYLETQGYEVTFLSPNKDGAITSEAVSQALRPNTQLIALMAVNNETGLKTDIETIGAIARDAGVSFVVDGVALLGKELFRVPEGVSAMFFSGHKIHAPKGVGFAYVRSKMKIQPLLIGGEQEFGRRAGSENLSGIIGLAEAVRLLQEELPMATIKMQALRDYFESSLQQRLADIKINGSGQRICNTSNLCFVGVEGETLLAALDLEGISVSHGSACASGALEPSRILLNMGLSKADAASSMRFSFSRFTTQGEIETCVETLIKLVNRLR